MFSFIFCFCFSSFVRWIQFLAVDNVYPEYNIWTLFASDTLATWLVPSVLYDGYPVEIPITQSMKTDLIFDNIIYEKGFIFKRKYFFNKNWLGSNIIRFLYAYIGNDAFRDGLATYFTTYAYKNIRKENLWLYLLQESEQLYLTHILSIWTKETSYPFITVCLESFYFFLYICCFF